MPAKSQTQLKCLGTLAPMAEDNWWRSSAPAKPLWSGMEGKGINEYSGFFLLPLVNLLSILPMV